MIRRSARQQTPPSDSTNSKRPPTLNHVLYLSSSRGLLDQAGLQVILETARRNNQRDDITGMLLYDSGSFIQYIEGAADKLAVIWRQIQDDTRHKGIIVASEGPAQERIFSDWSMGFQDGSDFGGFDLDWRALQGQVSDEFPTIVLALMRSFYQNSVRMGFSL